MIDLHHPALASDAAYRIADTADVLTPALAIYPDLVDANIAETLRLLGGAPNRWRPHVKTAKLASVMRRLVAHGIEQLKCATTGELAVACEVSARDVLLAYPLVGPHVRRVRDIAARYPAVRISALVENAEQVRAWIGSDVGLFVDVNPGMNRTGIAQDDPGALLDLTRAIAAAGLELRGLHYYDGQLGHEEPAEREAAAHRGYDRLMAAIAALAAADVHVPEVVTAGTPAFPCSLSYAPFARAPFVHRISPGTVVYTDATSLEQLPAEYNYRPAAVIVATVVSHPTPDRVTCNAGHKSVSADAGVPTCAVLGWSDLRPLGPSEEHLPLQIAPGSAAPAIGTTLYLVPRHVCPTVNTFDDALIVVDGYITGVERVTARGHEGPLLQSTR
jgi:D-serine deaminase-like pyridoxal phosphate-dependent protein